MAVIIEMPKLSDTMEEGGIASWLKEVGDSVEEGEPLVEIETDKATMEYASPEEGILLEILAKPGTAIALNAPIAVIGEKGETYDLAVLTGGNKPAAKDTHSSGVIPEAEAVADKIEVVQSAVATDLESSRIKASPLAKKMAKAQGIELSSLVGSGPNGRIIAEDVKSGQGKLASSTVASISMPVVADAQDVVIPNTMMRKTIAKRLLAGKNEAPHFYLTVSANMKNMMQWRENLNADPRVEKGELPKVSMNDLIMMATGKALKKHPNVNSSWQGDSIIQFGSVHLCMAVALPSGLVTPVIRNIDKLGVRQISAFAKEYGKRARDGQLTNEDYQGGTFTVSNLGMTKVEEFTAIINPPQAGILAVGSVVAMPWVNASGDIEVQHRMKMTLSSDHRVVDGMVGAKFLETLIEYLENPLMMMA